MVFAVSPIRSWAYLLGILPSILRSDSFVGFMKQSFCGGWEFVFEGLRFPSWVVCRATAAIFVVGLQIIPVVAHFTGV